MRSFATLVVLGALALVAGLACKSDEPTHGEAAKEAYDGTLDASRFRAVREAVTPFESWDIVRPRLRELVGPPGRVRGARRYWAFLEGERCVELVVENSRGQVGMVGVLEYDRAMGEPYEACAFGARTPAGQVAAIPARPADPRVAADEAPAPAGPPTVAGD